MNGQTVGTHLLGEEEADMERAVWKQQIQELVSKGNVLFDEPMSAHTTFRIGGPAECLVFPGPGETEAALSFCRRNHLPVTVIGNGSNLLVGDFGIEGVVIALGQPLSHIRVEGTSLIVGAGALLSRTAHAAEEAGLGGMEFAAGIPGSLGGAVVMNAGAYGGEMRDIVTSVTVLEDSGETVALSGDEMDFRYRHSCIQDAGGIVLEAQLSLSPGDRGEIRGKMEDFSRRRAEKQPLEFPSAGSTFKRPQGHFAGKLIMDAGLAGYTVGGARVSEKHCGFVVNAGGATASDVAALMAEVRRRVFERTGVCLEPEVCMVGNFGDGGGGIL